MHVDEEIEIANAKTYKSRGESASFSPNYK